MKHYLLLILFLFVSLNVFSQNFYFLSASANLEKFTIIDSAYIKCSYKLTYIKDTLKSDEKSSDLQILLIGKDVSKYYSQYALNYNIFIEEFRQKKPENNIPNINEQGAWTYEVFKNYPQGKETVTDIASMLGGFKGQNFEYQESLPDLTWKLSNDYQKVLSYNCQKATVRFRGRDFIAWFSSEIPISNGPWKFGGLPGLILKISDTKNNFTYECVGLELLKTKQPIKYYNLEYTKISRQKLYDLYKRFHDDMAYYVKMALGTNTRELDSKTNQSKSVEHSSFKIPYNPIELE